MFHCNITNLDEISSMRKRGFLIDFENECYIREGFGAYIRDLDNNDLLDGEIGNIVGMLVNSAAQYSLMTAEFERQQGYILEETKKELTIIRNIDDESILFAIHLIISLTAFSKIKRRS